MENSPELYHRVWDILVKHAGANEKDRGPFVRMCLEKDPLRRLTEYRFCGRLGFGGKFWRCMSAATRKKKLQNAVELLGKSTGS